MSKLKIAIQKSGRLHDQSIKLLKDCGLGISNGKDQLKVEVSNFPLEILYLRNSDIPQYIEDGTADIGIIGENLLFEYQKEIQIVRKLGFSKCRVSLAVPKEIEDTKRQLENTYSQSLDQACSEAEQKSAKIIFIRLIRTLSRARSRVTMRYTGYSMAVK